MQSLHTNTLHMVYKNLNFFGKNWRMRLKEFSAPLTNCVQMCKHLISLGNPQIATNLHLNLCFVFHSKEKNIKREHVKQGTSLILLISDYFKLGTFQSSHISVCKHPTSHSCETRNFNNFIAFETTSSMELFHLTLYVCIRFVISTLR